MPPPPPSSLSRNKNMLESCDYNLFYPIHFVVTLCVCVSKLFPLLLLITLLYDYTSKWFRRKAVEEMTKEWLGEGARIMGLNMWVSYVCVCVENGLGLENFIVNGNEW
jgi:hypothetical protein